MPELSTISKKVMDNISATRKSFKTEVIDQIGSDNTIVFYCKYYEIRYYSYIIHNGKRMENLSKLKYTLDELITWVSTEDFVEDKEILRKDIINMERFFDKALEARQASAAFLSIHAGLFDTIKLSDKEIHFKYKNEEVERFEDINHLLINDYLYNKVSKFNKEFEKNKHKRINKNNPYLYLAQTILDTEIELPLDYTMFDISMEKIKEFWLIIYKEAYEKEIHNRHIVKKYNKAMQFNMHKTNQMELTEIKIKNWDLEELKLTFNEVEKLLDIFSFNGLKKKDTIHSSFITEPIVKLPSGKYIVIPTSLQDYQVERYALQVFDKHISYGQRKKENIQTDDDKREAIFSDKLDVTFKNFKWKNRNIKVNSTDIDYIVYDEKSKSVISFELKWITEPYTPMEIKNKDVLIEKALKIQLPNYKKELESNKESILLKAFGKEFREEPEHYYYYALTNLTIGSGLVDRSEFNVINNRLLEKALEDSNYNLMITAEKLDREEYTRNYKNYIDSIESKAMCYGISITQPEFRYLNGFSLN